MTQINVKKLLKSISVLMIPLFLLSIQIGEASAKKVRGGIKLGKKSGGCRSNISSNRSASSVVYCSLGSIKYKFKVKPRKTGVKKTRKYILRATSVRRGKNTLRFVVTVKSRKTGKSKSSAVRLR